MPISGFKSTAPSTIICLKVHKTKKGHALEILVNLENMRKNEKIGQNIARNGSPESREFKK